MIAFEHNRLLIVTVGLITAREFGQMVFILLSIVVSHPDQIRRYEIDSTRLLRHHTDTRVHSCFRLHTGSHYRGLRKEQWHGLSLHVGTHQCTIGVIIL